MVTVLSAGGLTHFCVRSYLPRPELRGWVQCLWYLDGSAASLLRAEKLYPDAGASLSLHLNPSDPHLSLSSFLETRHMACAMAGPTLSVRFKPGGAYYLLGVDARDLGPELRRLEPQSKRPWIDELHRLLDKVMLANPQLQFDYALGLLELWLYQQANVKALQKAVNTPRILQALAASPLPIAALAAELGLTRRSLERCLQREAGVSPARLRTYTRMQHARQLLSLADASIADIALACGYCDQAHFTHAFNDFILETPAAYRQRKLSQIYKP